MTPRANDDGVRIVPVAGGRRLPWLIAAAIALPIVVTVVAVVAIRASSLPPPPKPAAAAADVEVVRAEAGSPPNVAPPAAPSASPRASHVVARRVVAAPVADTAAGLGASPRPDPRQTPARELDAGDAIMALREEGVHEGIAAFGLPGTSPPKSGIVVPEGFELPEGYVRHYQSTDDGQQLPAILMFHPDYEFRNERGEVVKVPDDLVVPKGMAPPGLDTGNVLDVPARKVGEPVH